MGIEMEIQDPGPDNDPDEEAGFCVECNQPLEINKEFICDACGEGPFCAQHFKEHMDKYCVGE